MYCLDILFSPAVKISRQRIKLQRWNTPHREKIRLQRCTAKCIFMMIQNVHFEPLNVLGLGRLMKAERS